MAFTRQSLGHGIGLRTVHFGDFLAGSTGAGWVEAITENFLAPGGRPLSVLSKVREQVPVALHGVSLSIGGSDPLSTPLLRRLRELIARVEPAYVSDHLCWGTHGGRYAHELLPLPYTAEALAQVVARVEQVQDVLGRQILLENVSSYVAYRGDEMPEWEFLAEVARRADCGILLDVNNVYVSARNHGFDALEYLAGIPPGRVGQFHLAGHRDKGRYLLDTHDAPVPAAVWELYRAAVRRFGKVPTLIEWDDNIPPLSGLLAESAKARAIEAKELPPAPVAAGMRGDGRRGGGAAGATSLAQAQRVFWNALAGDDSEAEPVFTGSEELPALERVHLYAAMVLWRQIDALRADFPRLAALLGDDAFFTLAHAYLRAHPSEHPSLSQLGAGLATYLRGPQAGAALGAAARDDLAGLAALEWARADVFEAADAQPCALEALLALSEGAFATAALRLVPALRLLELGADVVPLWGALGDDPELQPGPAHDANGAHLHAAQAAPASAQPLAAPGSFAAVAWRQEYRVFHVALAGDEAQALRLALAGAPLGEVCGAFAARPDPATAAFAALRSWFADGWIASVR